MKSRFDSYFPVEMSGNQQATVLVGIVTRNRAEILPKAIESALSQSYPRVTVSVVDDCSDDETWAVREDFPTIKWLRLESGRGYREARNDLMRTADSDYYISLDDDAWFLDRDEIALAIEHLDSNPRVGAVAFDILSPDRPMRGSRSTAYPVRAFIGCGHVLRTAAVIECGAYCPSPGLYGSEEKDLCLRLLDRKWEIHILPGVHVWHDKTMLERDLAGQHRSGVCNDLAFALRRCPIPLVIGVLPFKILSHLRFATRSGVMRPCLAGMLLFLRNAGRLLGSRAPVRNSTFIEFLRRSQ